MSRGHSDGWPYRKVTTRSVVTLISYGTLWHHSPKNYCEASGNEKTTEKSWELGQIIISGFSKQYKVIRKSDQTGKANWLIHP